MPENGKQQKTGDKAAVGGGVRRPRKPFQYPKPLTDLPRPSSKRGLLMVAETFVPVNDKSADNRGKTQPREITLNSNNNSTPDDPFVRPRLTTDMRTLSSLFAQGHAGSRRHIISSTRSTRQLMRRMSALGMEDPVFGNDNASTGPGNATDPSHLFDDMSFGAIPTDMQDLISVASDPTAELDRGLDLMAYQKNLIDMMMTMGGHDDDHGYILPIERDAEDEVEELDDDDMLDNEKKEEEEGLMVVPTPPSFGRHPSTDRSPGADQPPVGVVDGGPLQFGAPARRPFHASTTTQPMWEPQDVSSTLDALQYGAARRTKNNSSFRPSRNKSARQLKSFSSRKLIIMETDEEQ